MSLCEVVKRYFSVACCTASGSCLYCLSTVLVCADNPLAVLVLHGAGQSKLRSVQRCFACLISFEHFKRKRPDIAVDKTEKLGLVIDLCVRRVSISRFFQLIFSGSVFCLINFSFEIINFSIVGDAVFDKTALSLQTFIGSIPSHAIRIDSIIRYNLPHHIFIFFSLISAGNFHISKIDISILCNADDQGSVRGHSIRNTCPSGRAVIMNFLR